MAKGVIRRLLAHRGFGFIQSGDGRHVFFHRSAVLHVPFLELQEGQVVEFTVEETPQGPKARRVYVIEALSVLRQGDPSPPQGSAPS